MASAHGKAGFSLLEALVVLAVAGMALSLAFAAANHSADTGFRLGRRALDAADATVGEETLRTVLAAFLPPVAGDPPGGAVLAGSGDRLDGPALLPRATACAPEGPVGRLSVYLASSRDGDVVFCRADQRPAIALMTLAGERAALSYSDGGAWSARWSPSPFATVGAQAPNRRPLLMRLSTSDGKVEIIAAAGPGGPPPPPSAVVQPSGQGAPL